MFFLGKFQPLKIHDPIFYLARSYSRTFLRVCWRIYMSVVVDDPFSIALERIQRQWHHGQVVFTTMQTINLTRRTVPVVFFLDGLHPSVKKTLLSRLSHPCLVCRVPVSFVSSRLILSCPASFLSSHLVLSCFHIYIIIAKYTVRDILCLSLLNK
jgi:hypothetical protein